MIEQIFAKRAGARNAAEEAFFIALMQSACRGDLCLISDEPLGRPSPYVVPFGNCFYLPKNWAYEEEVVAQIRRLSSPLPLIPYTSPELHAEQHAALQLALSHSLSLITGGPGTGKTFLIRHLIQAMPSSASIILAAPTGKAAAKLKGLHPRALCGTLHSILNLSYLKADLIVVDECSMVDAKLFSRLLTAVQKGCRLVLVGDGDQLPPVESGSLFSDLVDAIPTAHLKRPMRSDNPEILNLAESIRNGVNIPIHESCDIDQLIRGKNFETFRLLSCVREGPWGVDTINRQIAAKKLPQTPILITKTDYALDLYNGETGTLLDPRHARFPARDGTTRTIPLSSLPAYEYAYCLSVHKSQGSEFDDVVLFVPPGADSFGREILYTAVTRAKKSIQIIAHRPTLEKILSRQARRSSGLRKKLQ